MQKGRYLLLCLIALGSIPASSAQNAETTAEKNAHHIFVPLVTMSLSRSCFRRPVQARRSICHPHVQ